MSTICIEQNTVLKLLEDQSLTHEQLVHNLAWIYAAT